MKRCTFVVILALAGCVGTPSTTSPVAPVDAASCTAERVSAVLQTNMTAFRERNPAPGFSAAAIVPGLGTHPVVQAVGVSDPDTGRRLLPEDRMLVGSVGKTFYAAAALKLVDAGRLELDSPIARYLAGRAIPHDDTVTVRMLLSHRSGYPPYDGEFMQALIAEPMRVRTFDDWVGPIRRAKSLAAPDATFAYSDVNYVVLANVIAGATGEPAETYIARAFLQPLQLEHTAAADRPRIKELVAGFEGSRPLFGADRVLDAGVLRFNPQFESGAGGYVSTAGDLAAWLDALHTGRAVSSDVWTRMATPTGGKSPTQQYGLGMHIDATPAGTAYGHSGYIPGYLSFVRYYPDSGVTLALQTNASDEARLPDDPFDLLDAMALAVAGLCPRR